MDPEKLHVSARTTNQKFTKVESKVSMVMQEFLSFYTCSAPIATMHPKVGQVKKADQGFLISLLIVFARIWSQHLPDCQRAKPLLVHVSCLPFLERPKGTPFSPDFHKSQCITHSWKPRFLKTWGWARSKVPSRQFHVSIPGLLGQLSIYSALGASS